VLKLKKMEKRANYAKEKGVKLLSYISNSCFKIHENAIKGVNEEEKTVFSHLLKQTYQNLDDLVQ